MKYPNDRPAASLNEEELGTLKRIVGKIIPADPESNLPGANDPDIFLDIFIVDQQQKNMLLKLVQDLTDHSDAAISSLDENAFEEVLTRFRTKNQLHAHYLQTITALAYYRDTRVLESIGVDPRPPFPNGYQIEPGDWELLEPVRARGQIYVQPDQVPLTKPEEQK